MKINYPLKYRLNWFGHPANGMLPQAWFGTVWQFGFSWREIPKILVISLIVLLNFPIALLESQIYRRRLNRIEIKNPIFIIGHPRSGTTFLHYLLSQDKRFVTPKTYQTVLPNTFLLTGWIFRPLLAVLMPSKRPMDEMSLGPNEPKEEEFALAAMSGSSFAMAYYFPRSVCDIFSRFVLFEKHEKDAENWKNDLLKFSRKISLSGGSKALVMKSPYNTARIKQILEVFPDARFIHIHRHPAEVLQSNAKLYQRLLPLTALQKPAGKKIAAFLMDSYVQVHEAYFREKAQLNQDTLIEIAFKDFIADPMKYLEVIYKQFDLSDFQKSKDTFQTYLDSVGGYRPETKVQDKDKSQLPVAWLEISRRLGYD